MVSGVQEACRATGANASVISLLINSHLPLLIITPYSTLILADFGGRPRFFATLNDFSGDNNTLGESYPDSAAITVEPVRPIARICCTEDSMTGPWASDDFLKG